MVDNEQVSGVELLCGQWSYAPLDGLMISFSKPIKVMDDLHTRIVGFNPPVKTNTIKPVDTPVDAPKPKLTLKIKKTALKTTNTLTDEKITRRKYQYA